MNDDFNEQKPRTKPASITSFKWIKVGLNGFYSNIPGDPTRQIWCMLHPRRPGFAGWQICEQQGDVVFCEGILEVTDVLDARNQAENVARIWVSDKKQKEAANG